MIKLTNLQCSALMTKTIQNLFSDESRQFPIQDAFKLSDLLTSVQSRMKGYFDQIQKIAKEDSAKIEANGMVSGLSIEAQKKIAELNRAELEYNFEKLDITDDWPKLSLSEASILRPLLNLNGGNKDAS